MARKPGLGSFSICFLLSSVLYFHLPLYSGTLTLLATLLVSLTSNWGRTSR